MSNSVRRHRWQPTRLRHHWDSPGKNTGVGWNFLLQCMKVKSESEVSQSCLTLSDPMDCSLPGSSVRGSFQQEYWSGLPFPSPFLPPTISFFHLSVSCSVVSDSFWPRGLYPTGLLCPGNFPGKSTAVGCHFLLQGIFPTRDQTYISCIGRGILYCLTHEGSPQLRLYRGLTL